MTGERAQQAIEKGKLSACLFNTAGLSFKTREQSTLETLNNAAAVTILVAVKSDIVSQMLHHPKFGPTTGTVISSKTYLLNAGKGMGILGNHGFSGLKNGFINAEQTMNVLTYTRNCLI
jgi:hypothetical protein